MILQVDHICKSFGDHRVLDELSFGVEAGEVVGLLGGNGAGKTTLLRIVTRLLEPDRGRILFDGHPISQDDMRWIGYLPEERGLYRRAAAGEQAVYMARLKGLSAKDAEAAVRRWFDRLGIADWWQRPVGRLSKGMQQKLQLIVTVAHSPRLLVFDEPFSGFDETNAAMLRGELQHLSAEGTAIILSTHNRQAVEICNKTVVL